MPRGKTKVTTKVICEICGVEFDSKLSNRRFCSSKCQRKNLDIKISNELIQNGVENVDYVICKWCGLAVKRIFGGHINKHHKGKNAKDYKLEFGEDVLIQTPDDKHNCSVNSGKFMKEDKYRKMFSEKFKGENNPMSKKNASEQKRKETSPFSIEFYKKRYPDLSEEECIKLRKDKQIEYQKDSLNWNHSEYWVNRGMTKEEAKDKVSELQARGLDFLIKKYGEEEGYKRWKDRNNKWKLKMFCSERGLKTGRSKIADELFNNIYNRLDIEDESDIMTGDNEMSIQVNDKNGDLHIFRYDFTIKSKNRIIEFNGDYWHCNPLKYNEDYTHPIRKQTAAYVWQWDDYKKRIANKFGYEVKVVWEKEYNDDPEGVVNSCMEFLKK